MTTVGDAAILRHFNDHVPDTGWQIPATARHAGAHRRLAELVDHRLLDVEKTIETWTYTLPVTPRTRRLRG